LLFETEAKKTAFVQPIVVKLQHLISPLSVTALMVFVPACATQSPMAGSSNIQSALVQAGFKSKLATTAQQQRRLQKPA